MLYSTPPAKNILNSSANSAVMGSTPKNTGPLTGTPLPQGGLYDVWTKGEAGYITVNPLTSISTSITSTNAYPIYPSSLSYVTQTVWVPANCGISFVSVSSGTFFWQNVG